MDLATSSDFVVPSLQMDISEKSDLDNMSSADFSGIASEINLELSTNVIVPSISKSSDLGNSINVLSNIDRLQTSDLDLNTDPTRSMYGSIDAIQSSEFIPKSDLYSVGLSEIYSSNDIETSTNYSPEISETFGPTEFTSNVGVTDSPILATPISDHLKSVQSVRITPYLLSELSSNDVLASYSKSDYLSANSMTPPSPTLLDPSSPWQPFASSTVAPPIATPRPTLPSDGGNVSSTGIPGNSYKYSRACHFINRI